MVRQRGKKPTQTLWIFCEGEKTEKNYFLKLRTEERIRRLKVKSCGSTDAKGIVNHAISFKKTDRNFEDGDSVCCIFDRDNNSNEQLEQATSLANHNNITIIFSNPSFEYWILCHFEYHPTSCENPDLGARLNYLVGDYEKNDPLIYNKTKNKIDTATANATRIKEKHEQERTLLISRQSNPLSLVFELIKMIKQFKN